MLKRYLEGIQEVIARFSSASFVVESSLDIDVRPGGQAYLVGKVRFVDRSVLHFREYLDTGVQGVEKLMYTYHYQDAQGTLIFRYDNAHHKPPLGYVEHKHTPDAITQSPAPALEDVLLEVVRLRHFEVQP